MGTVSDSTDRFFQPRLVAALLVTPLLAGVCTFAALFLVSPDTQIIGKLILAAFAVVVAVVVLTVGAGPLLFWWRRRHPVTLASCALWGGVFGNALTLLFGFLWATNWLLGRPSQGVWLYAAWFLSLGTLVGVACGIGFWAIAIGAPKAPDVTS